MTLSVRSLLVVTVFACAASPVHAQPEPGPLTLADAIRLAREASPWIEAAGVRLVGAGRAIELAGRRPNPSLELRTENWGLRRVDPAGATEAVDVFAVVGQPIEVGGKRRARIGIARAERDLAESQHAAAERALALETIEVYLDAVRARTLFEAVSASRSEVQRLVEVLRSRVGEGYAAEADLEKFRTEVARLDSQLVRLEVERDRRLIQLGSLVAAPSPIVADRLREPAAVEAPRGDPESLARAAAESRPEVRAAAARLERARRALSLATARRLPDPTLYGGYKRTEGTDTAVVGVTIPIPLFDRNGLERVLASSELDAARLELAETRRRAVSDAAGLIRIAQRLATTVGGLESELLAPARVVHAALHAAFDEGTADVLQVVDAERVYVDAQREGIELRMAALSAALQARLALGEAPR